ncbi:MAG TPA: methyltransferase domain-containing protein [Nitrospirales bacterium]|nr:methyltransferase domain-containing protein [Nitrospirales bacterium]
MANEVKEDNHAITKTVSERYAKAVTNGEQLCCPTGYNHEDLGQFIPEPVLKVSYGCGTPVGLSTVLPGEVVLDIGSGGGIDCFEASRKVGPQGRVIGIDMTDEMLALARRHAPTVAKNLGYPEPNVDFRKGFADAMPVEDDQVDLIVSNCVINLAPDKGKVFQEMFRVLRPGGRFTISDIVADQPIPKYLIYDKAKWGDCLSGALTIKDYWGGLRGAGFKGLHQVNSIPWRVIDGIQFLSVTLTGYKLASTSTAPFSAFATLTGPFSEVVDELGTKFIRGNPQQIDERTAELLALGPYQDRFMIAEGPVAFSAQDSRMLAIYPEEAPCVWEGHFAVLTGPFLAVCDDDDHTYQCGEPVEICSKTVKVLQSPSYQPYFTTINRSREVVGSDPVICGPSTGCC